MYIIAITGASGISIAVKLLNILKQKNKRTVLIISKAARQVFLSESNIKITDLEELATKNYDVNDLTAPPASGSYKTEGMIIVPCTMKTLAAIANGYSNNLITRAADVTIKENRKLILVVRESPLSPIHLENMLKLARLGVVIAPPIASYYINPESVDELLDHTVGRILDQIGIESDIKRWRDE
jgi:4-hydroxy-3-polyprenylbenzoate decarboxylase